MMAHNSVLGKPAIATGRDAMMTATQQQRSEKASYDEIPSLDLGPYLAGEKGALETLATKLAKIQQEIGLYYITNHGVSASLMKQATERLCFVLM